MREADAERRLLQRARSTPSSRPSLPAIRNAFAAARRALVFNFLSSRLLAGELPALALPRATCQLLRVA
jgi:hypothetical protein